MTAFAISRLGRITDTRRYERRAYLADAVVHMATVAAAVVAAAVLAVAAFGQRDLAHALALLIYGESLLITLSFSAVYNINRDPARVELLRCCDHAGIFAMIAGTYTPLAVFGLDRDFGAVLLVFMWLAAAIGATIKLRYPRRFEMAGIATYLALGWVLFPMLGPLSTAMPPESLWLLGLGAAIYSAGVGFHLAQRLPYNTVIWHICVLAGATCHFLAIYRFATGALAS